MIAYFGGNFEANFMILLKKSFHKFDLMGGVGWVRELLKVIKCNFQKLFFDVLCTQKAF